MSLPGIQIGGGITVGGGIQIGTSGGTPGINNITGYLEMDPPVIPGNQLEDGTATINGTTGFTINDDTATGVAITALSPSNQAWFASYGTGTKTITWGPGSTVASSTINLVTNSGATLVFYIQGQTGAATYNYPFTFS
jgi:hypothetical protein